MPTCYTCGFSFYLISQVIFFSRIIAVKKRIVFRLWIYIDRYGLNSFQKDSATFYFHFSTQCGC